MAHGDTVGDGDGGRIRAACRRPPSRPAWWTGLTHQGDVARRRLVPAACHAHEGLVNFGFCQPHGVIVRAVRRAFRPSVTWRDGSLDLSNFGMTEPREKRRTMALAA